MKKLTTLLLAAGLVVSSFTGAQAGSFTVDGHMMNQYTFGTGGSIYNHSDYNSALIPNGSTTAANNFVARNRIEVGMKYDLNENVSARFLTRLVYNSAAGANFGVNYGAGEFDSAYGDLAVREAYIDWLIPSTDVKVRMGYRPTPLPGLAFANIVLDPTARASGITISAPINENINTTFMWNRLASNSSVGNAGNIDIFSLAGDFNYDGFRFTPWAMYGHKGAQQNSTNTTGRDGWIGFSYTIPDDAIGTKGDYYWIGASFELSMFDPFRFAVDGFYSLAQYSKNSAGLAVDQDGFFVAAAASYKTGNGTPAVKAWYATGTDTSENGTSSQSGIVALAPHFRACTIAFADFVIADGYDMLVDNASPQGTWGVLAEWANMSFIDKVSHTARVTYFGGTSDLNGARTDFYEGLIDKGDSFVEIDFNTRYQVYKNFFTYLQLGYLFGNFENDSDNSLSYDDIARVSIGFAYLF